MVKKVLELSKNGSSRCPRTCFPKFFKLNFLCLAKNFFAKYLSLRIFEQLRCFSSCHNKTLSNTFFFRDQNKFTLCFYCACFFLFSSKKNRTILHAVHGQASIYNFFCHFCFLARWLQNKGYRDITSPLNIKPKTFVQYEVICFHCWLECRIAAKAYF